MQERKLMTFNEKLDAIWKKNKSLVCVGLDPEMPKLPVRFRDRPDGVFAFHKAIVDATHDVVCAFKPQFAHHAALGAYDQLAAIIDYIHDRYPNVPVILDAKRGDMGNTAMYLAQEAFDRFNADAVTVSPYLGTDAIEPFTKYRDRGTVLLCRTSNPGAADLQELLIDGLPLYMHVAKLAAQKWNANNNVSLVVGATAPRVIAEVRKVVGDMPLLVPGVGAQGGDVAGAVAAGRTGNGTGLMISASRSVLYASSDDDFAHAARGVVEQMIADGASC
jgi:orotidine-5'-phosphate decarboxylase